MNTRVRPHPGRSVAGHPRSRNYQNAPYWLYGLVLSAVTVFFFSTCDHRAHLHDFAEWMFQGKVLALKLTDPQKVISYQLAPYPVPNSLVVFCLAALNLLAAPVLAGKIFQMVMLIFWCIAALLFCRRWLRSPERQASVVGFYCLPRGLQ